MSSGVVANVDRELRTSPRREVRLPVSVRDAAGAAPGVAEIVFDTRDLSTGGAFLRSDLFFEVGEEIEIDLRIPDGPTVVALARVVHVLREVALDGGACPGMGIAFTQIGDRERAAIQDFVRREDV